MDGMDRVIVLGTTVLDGMTDFRGVAIARCEHLDGTTQYCVQPTASEDGSWRSSQWIDGERLDVVTK